MARGYRPYSVLAGVDDDDCAVLTTLSGFLVISTDYLNASPISVQLGIATGRDLGRLLVGVNLSDLLGSGAAPTGFLAAITLRREATQTEFEEIMEGVASACSDYNVPLIGGDTKLGAATALCGTAIGFASEREQLLLRNQAQPGDTLWVSGPLGACAAATLSLEPGDVVPDWVMQAIVRPVLPLAVARAVRDIRIEGAGTDLSDGLGADLASLCRSSGVSAVVEADRVPLNIEVEGVARAQGLPAHRLAFAVGGDLQFLVSAAPKFSAALAAAGMVRIGYLRSQEQQSIISYDQAEMLMPTFGHRDARGLTFKQEVAGMVRSEKWLLA